MCDLVHQFEILIIKKIVNILELLQILLDLLQTVFKLNLSFKFNQSSRRMIYSQTLI